MSIAKMKHLQVIALRSDRDELMKALLHLGSVEISEPKELSEADAALVKRDDHAIQERKSDLRQLQQALQVLRKYESGKKGGFLAPRPQISESAFLDAQALEAQLTLARKVIAHGAEVSRLQAFRTRLNSDVQTLRPWIALDLPMEELSTRTAVLEPGAVPSSVDLTALQGQLADAAPEAEVLVLSESSEQKCLLLIAHRAVLADAMECLRKFGFSVGQLKGRKGTVSENLAALQKEIEQTENLQKQEEDALRTLAGRVEELQLGCDRVQTEIGHEENRSRLLTDGCIVAFTGWVQEKELAPLEKLLGTYDCAWDVRDVRPEEYAEVPVRLQSNKFTRSMNCITEQYSMPAYDGVDPNPIMAPFFIFFFGMMMADMAYGLLMIIGTQIYLHKKRPADRSFMEMFFWCGISTFIFGALTGGFFGDFIPQLFKLINPDSNIALPHLFSPLEDTMPIMIGSLVLGFLQIITGMTISVVKKCQSGGFLDALFDEITWWIIFAGGGMLVLGLGVAAKLVLAAGIVMLLYGGARGKKGFGKVTGIVAVVYNGITGFFSDILSYVRLMALMLSGAVLAQVFNMLGATTGNAIAFLIIAMVGNGLNLALNLLGCYVHDMRLQFLEFFGRFYKEGGKAFRPLSVQTKYVEVLKEEK